MRPQSRRGIAALCLALIACGPAVSATGEGETGSDSNATSTTTASGGSATALPPATVTPTSADATGPDSTTVTGPPEPVSTGNTSEASSGDGTEGSLPPTDIPPVITLCSVWDNECPDGEKCVAWSSDGSGVWDSARCSPAGPAQVGEDCAMQGGLASGHDSCALGTMCWGVDPETNNGHCTALCYGSEDAPVCDDPTRACVIGNAGSLNVCLTMCDPLTPDCPKDDACYGTDRALICAPPGTPLVTQPAQLTPALCPPGSTAVQPELDANCEDDALCCAPWCDLSMLNSCAAGMTCEPWFKEGMMFGFEDVGACLDVPIAP